MTFQEWMNTARMKPKIVCICGSSRFVEEIAVAAWKLEKQGIIAFGLHLLPHWYQGIQTHHQAEAEGCKQILDELHLRKIDLSDEVLAVTVGGYIGDSALKEIEYAKTSGKPVNLVEIERRTSQ
jgi:hypothetical protein